MLTTLNCAVSYSFCESGEPVGDVEICATFEETSSRPLGLRFFSEDPSSVSLALNGTVIKPETRDSGSIHTLIYRFESAAYQNKLRVSYRQKPRFLSDSHNGDDAVWVCVVPLRQFRDFGVHDELSCELSASLPSLDISRRILLRKRSLVLGGRSDSEERGVVFNSKCAVNRGLITAAYGAGFSFPDQFSVKAGNF